MTVNIFDDNIKLGERYRDRVSGWEGVATARYEYLNGCVRVEVSHHDKDGKPEAFVFDWQQIEAVSAAPVEVVETKKAKRRTGGPQDSKPVAR